MREVIGWIVRGLAIAGAVLATAQPVLGSFAYFRPGDPVDYQTLHLVMGGLLYNVALLLTILAPFTRFRRRWIIFLVGLVQYGLTHVQLLLGLNSSGDAGLLAYHIPIGVLIFLISYLTVALGFGAQLKTDQA